MNSFLLDGSLGKMRVKVVHRKMFPVLMYAVSCDGATAVWLLQVETTGQCAMVPGPVHRHNFSHTRCTASVWGQSPGDVAPNTISISMLYTILICF